MTVIVAAPILNSLTPLQQFVFDGLSDDELTRFVGLRHELDDTALELQFEDWVREHIKAKKEKS